MMTDGVENLSICLLAIFIPSMKTHPDPLPVFKFGCFIVAVAMHLKSFILEEFLSVYMRGFLCYPMATDCPRESRRFAFF